MKAWIQVLIFLSVCSCNAQTIERPPEPPYEIPELIAVDGIPSGYNWEFKDGPDFYTYIAKNEKSGVSIYFGTHPHFDAKGKERRESSTVLSTEANWYSSREDSGLETWEALIPYRHSPAYAELTLHIWIWGADEITIRPFLDHLRKLKFNETTYEDRKKGEPAD